MITIKMTIPIHIITNEEEEDETTSYNADNKNPTFKDYVK